MNQELYLIVFSADLKYVLIQQILGAHEMAEKSNGLSK